jgi:hypothetical protein
MEMAMGEMQCEIIASQETKKDFSDKTTTIIKDTAIKGDIWTCRMCT